jgi:hypothetical protein
MKYRYLVFSLLFVAGCRDREVPDRPRDAGMVIDGPGPGEVTYREHIAPLLSAHCVRCHVGGGIAPFVLTDWASSVRVATRMAEATRARVMPPYYADDSGDCQTHRDANWLTDAEIQLFEAWAADPAHPEGDTSIPIPPPTDLPTIARVDGVVDLGFDFTPAPDDGAMDLDELRCFLIDPGIATDRFLVSYQVVPGEPRVVHHVIVYEPAGDPTADAAALEALDPRPGWRCDGGAGLAGTPVVLWAPGVGATTFPAGTGIRMIGGRPVVLQIHYNFTGGALPDRTRVELMLEDAVPAEAVLLSIADPSLALAPRRESVSTTGTITVPANGFVWGVLPHMHQRGLGMRVTAGTGASEVCLLQTVNWDFHWQQAYFFTAPVELSRGMPASITCTYDTMSDTDTITWGESTADEMCINYVYATAVRP